MDNEANMLLVALVQLLMKKGVFTEDEINAEIKLVSEEAKQKQEEAMKKLSEEHPEFAALLNMFFDPKKGAN